MTLFKKLQDNESGSSTLEFVVVFPFLLAIMFVIMNISWVMFVQHNMDRASREGARAYALYSGTSANACSSATANLVALPATGSKPQVKYSRVAGSPDLVRVEVATNAGDSLLVSFPLINSAFESVALSAYTVMVPEWDVTSSISSTDCM